MFVSGDFLPVVGDFEFVPALGGLVELSFQVLDLGLEHEDLLLVAVDFADVQADLLLVAVYLAHVHTDLLLKAVDLGHVDVDLLLVPVDFGTPGSTLVLQVQP